MKIGIVSCDKYKNKIAEDLLLKEELQSRNIETCIISWERDEIDKFDALVIRSIWGYQYKYEEFLNLLEKVHSKKIIMINDYDTIKKHIDKESQFEILLNNKISIMSYKIVEKENLFKEIKNAIDFFSNKGYNKYVIKPTISESGHFTYCFGNSEQVKLEEIIKKEEKMLDDMPYEKLIIQPFYEEVLRGEYSCIILGGKIIRKVLRFTGKLYERKEIHQIVEIYEDEKRIIEKIYKCIKATYMRVDYIKTKNNIKIMEVEVIDPDLFSRNVNSNNEKQNFIKIFTNEILKEVKNNA